ncbi:MAG: hypothetical protein AABY22_18385, partial [Nanoarchaeota archaeon]
HKNLANQYHSDLRIIINDVEQTIPADIGISSGVMRPLHTHDSSGEVHAEGTCPREFVIGDFFKIWNKTFNESCVFEYCSDKGNLTMKVNGNQVYSMDKYIIRDGEDVLIEYKK